MIMNILDRHDYLNEVFIEPLLFGETEAYEQMSIIWIEISITWPMLLLA